MRGNSVPRRCSVRFCRDIATTPYLTIVPLFAMLAGVLLAGVPLESYAAESSSTKEKQKQTKYTPMTKKMKQEKVQTVTKGTSSREARKKALAALPLNKLTKQQQKQVRKITQNTGMFRAMPTLQFQVNPDAYHFLVKHPDVVCSIWRVMKISDIEMFQTSATEYDVDMKDGTVGTITVLQYSKSSSLVVCDGKFKSPFLPTAIKAVALIHLHSKQIKDQQGRKTIVHRANLFVSFPSQTVEAAAKLISPVSNMMMDRNFHEVSLFTQMMSLAMQRQPGWVERTAMQMKGVLKERKPQLVKLAAKVYVAHRREVLSKAGKKNISLEDVMKPLRQTSAEVKK